ncbi:hypothetical protein BN1723_019229, partial [Verticillium longisporum]
QGRPDQGVRGRLQPPGTRRLRRHLPRGRQPRQDGAPAAQGRPRHHGAGRARRGPRHWAQDCAGRHELLPRAQVPVAGCH